MISKILMAQQIPQEGIPPQPVQKTNWILYIITVAITFAILVFIGGILSISTSFLTLTSFTALYIFISIVSLVIGLISALLLNKIAKSNKSFLLGGSIVSFLSAAILSVSLSVQKRLAAQMAGLETGGMVGLFGEMPNAFLTGILIIIFFNIPFLILFFRKEQKSMKDLMIYLYSFIIFLILYFIIPLVLLYS